MAAPETQPETQDRIKTLHGDWVYRLKISQEDDDRTLAITWRALEWGKLERAKTSHDPRHAGIGVVELFQADLDIGKSEPIPLEMAEAYNPYAQRFLLSMATSGLAVVTSRFGYKESGAVTVLPRTIYTSPRLDTVIDMHDYAHGTTNDVLSRHHVERVMELGGNPDAEIAQSVVDATFRYMVGCSPERL